MSLSRSLFTAAILGFSALSPLAADPFPTSQGALEITEVANGLDIPWGFNFLPNGDVLLTERDGKLIYISEDGTHTVQNPPKVAIEGQGGLLDVLVPRDFAQTREVLFTAARRTNGGHGTAVLSARLSPDGKRLSAHRVLFQVPGDDSPFHFGSRLREGHDGSIYVSLGERGTRQHAQNIGHPPGSILRLRRNGKPYPGNPFVDTPGAAPEIWSFGHRNPQGMAIDAQGEVWVSEHGAKGGDEINLIQKGANYGWPIISYGRHYSGAKIGVGTHQTGLQQPKWYWDPSIAPSGLMIYSGKLWPEWEGDFFVGSLKFDYISRLEGTPLKEVEQLKSQHTGRIRDVREAPDGSIWFASQDNGALYRITPKVR
ncbi:PQQ-dependent sugar dehydrogenase [Epibacterium ulvae]|uniref:PQQ-dependent sugar dehydrogenase n=1 Tax=Epibacterium ulvae TaxID=1156985 RepID=UPI002491ED46|nr:PQQ-dependent sugar dehydrogenase [Epibacterium ulvae]